MPPGVRTPGPSPASAVPRPPAFPRGPSFATLHGVTKHLARVVRWILFVIFALIGLIGIAIPVMPQIPFLIAAAIVIMPESPAVRRKYVQWRKRHPAFFEAIERWRRTRREARQAARRAVAPAALLAAAVFAGAAAPGAGAGDVDPARYRFGPAESKLTFKAFRDGWFSSLGHDHTLAARDFEGAIALGPAGRLEASAVTVTVKTATLEVLDPGVDARDKAEVAEAMKSSEVLDVKKFPEIVFRSTAVKVVRRDAAEVELEVSGDLALHGKTRAIKFPLILSPPAAAPGEPLKAKGTIKIDQTDFGITPYGVGLGAVKVKDRVELDFEVLARPAAAGAGAF